MITKYLIRDLKLELILDAMANGDETLKNTCKNHLIFPLNDCEKIITRQEVLKDALRNEKLFLDIYRKTSVLLSKVSAYDEITKPLYNINLSVVKKILTYSEIALLYVDYLKRLYEEENKLYDLNAKACIVFINSFKETYTKDFLQEAELELKKLMLLKENSDIVIGGHFGTGMKITDIKIYEIEKNGGRKTNRPAVFNQNEKKNLIPIDNSRLEMNEREMIDTGLSLILKIIMNFSNEMRNAVEGYQKNFGFYAGAINLYQVLSQLGVTVCYPNIWMEGFYYEFAELVDAGLVLKGEKAVSNSISAENKLLWIITGANQGGKTTFLRSVGLAQLMAQAGLFVTAKGFKCPVYQGIYTHFPDEEDATLQSGLLEKELKKMDCILKQLKPGSMLLMNESFATTTEFDACCLAEEITDAFCECNITTFFVTHNYKYASSIYEEQRKDTLFLRAGRNETGERNYQIGEGEPLKSSYALDLYEVMIGSQV